MVKTSDQRRNYDRNAMKIQGVMKQAGMELKVLCLTVKKFQSRRTVESSPVLTAKEFSDASNNEC